MPAKTIFLRGHRTHVVPFQTSELKIFGNLRCPVAVELRVKPAEPGIGTAEYWQECHTRNSGNPVLPTVNLEHGREQSTTGQRTDAQAGWKQCTTCGKDFEPSKYCVRKQKYCSYQCKRSDWISRRASSHGGSLLDAATSTAR